MTKQERKAVYTAAKQNIVDSKGANFLCGQFSNILGNSMDDCITLLPEFGLFEPTPEENDEYGAGICWFVYKANESGKTIDNEWLQMERMICLDLCLLMLKDGYLDE